MPLTPTERLPAAIAAQPLPKRRGPHAARGGPAARHLALELAPR